jgi:hypothetical protein
MRYRGTGKGEKGGALEKKRSFFSQRARGKRGKRNPLKMEAVKKVKLFL